MRGKGAKLGDGDPERKNPEKGPFSGFLCSGFSPFSGFGIFTFGIVLFGKSLWRRVLPLKRFIRLHLNSLAYSIV